MTDKLWVFKRCNNERDKIHPDTPKSVADLISKCWGHRAEERPQAREVVEQLEERPQAREVTEQLSELPEDVESNVASDYLDFNGLSYY